MFLGVSLVGFDWVFEAQISSPRGPREPPIGPESGARRVPERFRMLNCIVRGIEEASFGPLAARYSVRCLTFFVLGLTKAPSLHLDPS